MRFWRRIALPFAGTIAFLIWSIAAKHATSNDQLDEALVPVAVRDGAAQFDLATQSRHDQHLIIISSLSTEPGPFSVQVTTSDAPSAEPIEPPEPECDENRLGQIERRREQLAKTRQVAEPTLSSGARVDPPAERTFWLMVRGHDFTDLKNYEAVTARLVATGRHAAVYRDQTCTEPTADAAAREAIETFDRDVFPVAQQLLGRHRDVDGDGLFTILLTPWLGRLSGGSVAVGGFVRGSDFYPSIEAPLGNRCDMMYLNSSVRPGPHLRTLVAHEYTHAITLSEHVFGQYLPDCLGCEEESWLDEAIAHIAENLHGYSWSNLDYRVNAYLAQPDRYRLVVDDYYAANLWRAHGNRGSTYLFLRWCVDQFGEEILKSLVQTNLYGIENVEVSTGKSFAELYRNWSSAVFFSHSGMASRPADAMRFLNLRAPLSGRLLAGPRYDYLSLRDDTPERFALAGTSTKYFVAHSPRHPHTRIAVSSEPEAKLQVSVRRLPARTARLQLTAAWNPVSEADRTRSLAVQISEHNGVAVELEHIQWDRAAHGSNTSSNGGEWGPLYGRNDIARLFGSATLPASGSLGSADFTSDAEPDRDLVLKVTGRDTGGYAVSAWCTVPGTPPVLAETERVTR